MINFIFISGERDAMRPDLGNRRFATFENNQGENHMSVKKWTKKEIMDRGTSDSYVQLGDFDDVLLALRSVYKTCVIFARNPNNTTAAAIRDFLQNTVDQYE